MRERAGDSAKPREQDRGQSKAGARSFVHSFVTELRQFSTDWTLAQFDSDCQTARQHLDRFVDEGLRRHQREPLTVAGSVFFGAPAFVRANTTGLEAPAEIPRPHWQPMAPTLDDIFVDAPDPIATAYREYGYTLREIGEHLDRRHHTTISRRLRQGEMHQRKT
jgi:hypothetical protein